MSNLKIIIKGCSGSYKSSFYLPVVINKMIKNNENIYMIPTAYNQNYSSKYWKKIKYQSYQGQTLNSDDIIFIDDAHLVKDQSIKDLLNHHPNVVLVIQDLEAIPWIDLDSFEIISSNEAINNNPFIHLFTIITSFIKKMIRYFRYIFNIKYSKCTKCKQSYSKLNIEPLCSDCLIKELKEYEVSENLIQKKHYERI